MRNLRWIQRLVGLLLLVACGSAVWWVWRSALASGSYSRAAAALLPAACVIGLGFLVAPFDVGGPPAAPSLFKHDTPQLPAVWQYFLLVAVLAGLANWYAIALWL